MYLPLPFVDTYLDKKITAMIASELTCAADAAVTPTITLKGGRLLPQLMRQRLSEIQLSVPGMAIGGVKNATFTANLRGVSRSAPGVTRADDLKASISIGFADLPVPPNLPRPSFGRSVDGSLTVKVVPGANQAKNVRATLFLTVTTDGKKAIVRPQKLRVFGRMLPATKFAAMTGGDRSQTLPSLPAGLKYTSITPKKDGLHVALNGTVTTPLSALPTEVGGRTVSYVAENGLLGISTSIKVPPIIDVPLTIFTTPRLDGGTLTLEPRAVRVLGSDRPPDDSIASLVLSQVDRQALTRRLPALPTGVRYRSVSVDNGITVAVGGVTVRPFSALPATSNGRAVTYGAQDGFLTATTKGTPSNGSPTPVVLAGHPRIVGNTLDLAPRTIQMFDTVFPAADVMAQIGAPATKYPLEKLPGSLSYAGVSVAPGGLQITVRGKGVTLSKGLMGGTGCASGPAGNA
ncbi:MAG: hypothetical protein QG622_64 [Actinomycetota bacterium]|nr:hypothetical protein [Actinomycetota bacterium]